MNHVTRGKFLFLIACFLMASLVVPAMFAQETTAGIQGTVKDPSGGFIAKASVEVTGDALLGNKKTETNSGGYFRFANLPPGHYTVVVTASGFKAYKEDIALEVGHLPALDVTMQIGTATETVEVAAASAIIDVTQSKVQTNLSDSLLNNLPTQTRSFQSYLQFAPGARTEPLQGGYQLDGASNSENSYLVEGQETASINDGSSRQNVPLDFIQEVQVKSSGFEAEYGGALGGVVNVIQKRGSNEWHGTVFMYYSADTFDSNGNRSLRRDPTTTASSTTRLDQPFQFYQPIKDHYHTATPGFTLGGDLIKDRLWIFGSTAPAFSTLARTENVSYNSIGPRTFHQDSNTYYSMARVDFMATQRIRLYAGWQDSYNRLAGSSLPGADSTTKLLNTSASTNPDNYNYGIGSVNPQVLFNSGADITINPNLVATTHFGYLFYNSESRGTASGIRYVYSDTNYSYGAGAPAPATTKALNGTLIPAQFVNTTGFATIPANFATAFDAWKRWDFHQDLAWFKRAGGTHNFKFGYGFMHGTNDVQSVYNSAFVYVGYNAQYYPTTSAGLTRCAAIVAQNQSLYGAPGGVANGSQCQGLWGTINLHDGDETIGKVGGWNHSLYAQDSWTVSRRLTLNLGLRLDKENLPSYDTLPGFQGISFGWGDKLAPRLGAAYDLLGNGKIKIYGSFGYFYDIMKFNLPRGSFGGDYWHDCAYALDTPDYTTIIPQRDAQGHYCPLGGGATPAVGQIPNARFIENVDYRAPSNDPNQDGSLGKTGLVDPNLKPMKQHLMEFGMNWALTPSMAFEARYSRKRLDRTIEDAGTITNAGEVYYIVNPGFGINAAQPNCNGCPANYKAIRDYDGIEFRLTKRMTANFFGSFSYTYSRLWGNYSGLTATDVSDAVGRNGANTDRAFDEPFMSWDAHGKDASGLLATDRPNTVKVYGYYNLKYKKYSSMIGFYQQAYSGTPLTSYLSVWGAPVFIEGRGKWVDITRDPSTGNFVLGNVSTRRTPMFSQSDISYSQDLHVSSSNEKLIARLGADCINCFNQHSPVVINSNIIRTGQIKPALCGSAGTNCTPTETAQAGFDYGAVMAKGYDYIGLANSGGLILSSEYGQPQQWQNPRTLRLMVMFTF